ncbi:PREDICTED: LEAF RUST 10 DISEASE-RESISTANCE LOCUS RECEPTOR-LIKE PROTEIN KINASE-like 1.1 isoform X5 [Nelumbo nucifera]|uniref:non-specific serine/threonine protein kinase n=1 Tax=Nelumbo nucifera TaxID=4432 RepID=A0A1U8BQ04_NELNU|nr:PREDICTED: LEAF RUST 10 DISEASE-RESISTANCE LOCUS RECEPTOR-LIKE PROTEIN KINASE-like 1.1 isoform X5 [Nelumbo nucifera]
MDTHGFVVGGVYSFLFLVSFHLALHSADDNLEQSCLPFDCGNSVFSNAIHPDCGLMSTIHIECPDGRPTILLGFCEGARSYQVQSIFGDNNTIVIRDSSLHRSLESGFCDDIKNFSSSTFNSLSFRVISPNITLFSCKREDHHDQFQSPHLPGFHQYPHCRDHDLFFGNYKSEESLQSIRDRCSVYQIPVRERLDGDDLLLPHLEAGFSLQWEFPPQCNKCDRKELRCVRQHQNGTLTCPSSTTDKKRWVKVALGISSGVIAGAFLVICIVLCRKKLKFGLVKRKDISTPSTTVSSNPSSRTKDLEKGSIFMGVSIPIFTYEVLEEATNNFDASKELGDGGFGTVYHGKLRDGRDVAVKRLYENNYRRVEQFMNEIEILTRLRHKNLVTLYGCTSRRSRELILVYEYIPNGTVADHLHGDRAKAGGLPWSIRMSIALETAGALTYLHASDIIHRDVKTNNILLDNNFSVKVADFGLSRLFPTDATHVSTAPQGTPGYVDPEYHQCYQLTGKSDVYSFGVVLIELISSKPAVDISRHRHEINLATMAMNKIQNRALHELVDPDLNFESDSAVRRMVTGMAELAFRCLQYDREMRPTMDEALEILNAIGNEDYNVTKTEEVDTQSDQVGLLKNNKRPPTSPVTVTYPWSSEKTTPNTSS